MSVARSAVSAAASGLARASRGAWNWDRDGGAGGGIPVDGAAHGARGNAGTAHGRRVAITTRWLGDDVRFLPTNWAKAQKAVGIAQSGLVLGSQARGDYFPLVWNGQP